MSLVDSIERHKDVLYKGGAAVALAGLGLYLFCRSQTDHVISDWKDTIFLLAVRRQMKAIESSKSWTVVDMFNDTLKKFPNQEAIRYVDTGASYTFRQLDEESNKIANWALSSGIQQGEVVALMMDNRPEFLITWLGLAKIGAAIALINTNLSGPPLVHSLRVSGANQMIIGAEHGHEANLAKRELPGKIWFSAGAAVPGFQYIDELLKDPSHIDPSHRSTRGPTSDLLYIYTSGTTGYPKAGIIKNIRFFMAGIGFARSYGVTHNDRIYCSLPLYHSAGGMIGVGMSWFSGATFVIRKKFSSKKFWQDIHENRCTVFQYIGELCRYLLQQPPTEFDKSNVRVAIGNGLRADIWDQFQSRFNIKEIGEFYAATEGNTGLLNTKNKSGAVGWIPPLIFNFYPLAVIKLEDDNETPKRDARGNCIACKPGEKGELLGKIDNSDPSRKFDGYTDEESTKKKILTDVFKKGDTYFRSGDLLRFDKDGFFYFVDRLGDTFRWKGENVATGEVEGVIAEVPGVVLVNVYGVTVPNNDGRAGMAALVTDQKFDFGVLYQKVTEDLPSYARPLFLRMMPEELETTSTHKLQKVQVRNEGFDIHKIKEDIYFRDDQLQKYVKVDEELFQKLQGVNGQAKL